MTVLEFHEKLKTGKASARELISAYLEKIKKENKSLNAYLEVFEEDAIAQAQKIDERIASGETPGVLWGVPVAVKDNILIEGKIASASSKILENYIASYSATAVKKLEKAGAIILGRTNMDEFAMGSSTENSAYGATRNPLDHSRVPGGSSGGSVAAVAADLAVLGLGSETGGSVRQPAAFCGVVGLKPTYGAVSRNGLIAMASSLDHIGPIAKNIGDCKILFDAIKGKDDFDSTSMDPGPALPAGRLRTMDNVKRIGIPKEYFEDGLDERIKKSINNLVKRLEKKYEIRHVSLPHTKYALACYYIIMPAEASSNLARFDGIRYGVQKKADDILGVYEKSRGAGLGLETRRRILLGTYVLSSGYYDAYYSRAQKVRNLIAKDFENVFKEVDVLLTPATPTLPFKFGEKTKDPVAMYLADIYTAPANLVGIAGISLPVGFVPEGGKNLPIGAQLLAPSFCEDRLFEAGEYIENLVK
ncbi:MAG: Asp-tRNA(Asn)/Glu-tRNA(Gln) amidotransferase subunit GatA [Patescibacteria group bacterium]